MIEQAPTSTPPESVETPEPAVIDAPTDIGLEEYAVRAATNLVGTTEARREPLPIKTKLPSGGLSTKRL